MYFGMGKGKTSAALGLA
ncbi:MAG: hypothetical protein LBC21_02470, partial [Oscillospiraceae bacterium]|nr:hypothetical protein [Oscillospiraceae bacterium]